MKIFMPRRRASQAALLAAWVGLLFPGSCHKQKPAVPPQAEAPTVSEPQAAPPQPEPAPAETQPAETQPAVTPPAESAPPSSPSPKPRPKSHPPAKKVVPAPPATPAPSDTPAKTVVPQGSTPSTGSQLTPNLTAEEAERMRQGTVQRLAATEDNLKKLPESLTREQQVMVEDIRSYMAQSRTAMAENDLVRAYNLAEKAHLLSNALPRK